MALDEAKNPQARDQKPNAAGAGALIGIGAGVQPSAPSPAVAGAVTGAGGGAVQGGVAPAPSGGGGGGGAAPASDPYAALSALGAAGLTAADVVALANRGSQPAAAAPAPVYAGNGYNGGAEVMTAPSFAAEPAVGDQYPSMDPQTMAILAAYDQQLNDQISGFRRNQDESARSLADAIPELGRSFDLNRESVKDAFEGRGLLKSGETEQAVGRTYEDQARRQSDLEKNSADQIANIEQQIAAARTANAIARNNALLQSAGTSAGNTVGSVS